MFWLAMFLYDTTVVSTKDPNPDVEKAGRSGQENENNFDFDFRLWSMIIYDL